MLNAFAPQCKEQVHRRRVGWRKGASSRLTMMCRTHGKSSAQELVSQQLTTCRTGQCESLRVWKLTSRSSDTSTERNREGTEETIDQIESGGLKGARFIHTYYGFCDLCASADSVWQQLEEDSPDMSCRLNDMQIHADKLLTSVDMFSVNATDLTSQVVCLNVFDNELPLTRKAKV